MDSAEDVADGVACMNSLLTLYWSAIVGVAIGAFLIAALMTISEKPKHETSITCTTNDSQIHEVQGWKKIETVDYHRIGAQVSKGKAQVECKPGTLMCTAFIDGKAYPETKGCAWYWRKV